MTDLVRVPAPAAPLLSICVPTYKRAGHVSSLVDILIANILEDDRYDVEVVVVNNASPDFTREALSHRSHRRLRVVNRDVHLDTAEENMFRSLSLLTGEFIWFLGDDDILNTTTFPSVYEMLKSGDHTCLIFNSPLISPSGKLARRQPMPMLAAKLEAKMDVVVESIGLLFTFAGISNVIQRRSQVSEARALEWLAISKIYSHVAWIVEAHKGTDVTFVNMPLVYYRENDYSDGHWDRVAKRNDVQNLYFWSVGLVKLLRELVSTRSLSHRQAGLIFELAGDGRRYRLVDDVVFKIHQQLELWVFGGDERQRLNGDEVDELCSFCLECDPTLFDLMCSIRDISSLLNGQTSNPFSGSREEAFTRFKARFIALFDERQSAGQFSSRFVGMLHGYEVYQMPLYYVGVPEHDVDLRERVLRLVDPVTLGTDVLVADSLAGLEALASAARIERHAIEAMRRNTISAPTPVLERPVLPTEELFRLIDSYSSRLDASNERLVQVFGSTSWSVSAPVRFLSRLFGRRAT